MNETYQHPGKWHDQILHPSVQRYDSRTFIMSYIIIALEHNSVYEVMVQAKNMYGWNEVSLWDFKIHKYTYTHPLHQYYRAVYCRERWNCINEEIKMSCWMENEREKLHSWDKYEKNESKKSHKNALSAHKCFHLCQKKLYSFFPVNWLKNIPMLSSYFLTLMWDAFTEYYTGRKCVRIAAICWGMVTKKHFCWWDGITFDRCLTIK